MLHSRLREVREMRIVYLLGLVAALLVAPSIAVAEHEFSFDWLGYTDIGNGDYLHEWALNITTWDPGSPSVTDVDIVAPHIYPGYVVVTPPANWAVGPWYIGRYSYEANPGSEFTNAGYYTGWKVVGKTPVVVAGTVWLTNNRNQISGPMQTMVVADIPEPGSLLALGSGLIAVAGMVIRRRR